MAFEKQVLFGIKMLNQVSFKLPESPSLASLATLQQIDLTELSGTSVACKLHPNQNHESIALTAKTLGVVMDPIASINPKKDTTLAILLAAQKRGWNIIYFELADIGLEQEIAIGHGKRLKVFDDLKNWFDFEGDIKLELGTIDAILMRKDPPFDSRFLMATHILEAAEKQGALVVNKPSSLRDCNEKLFATEFPQCGPELIVSANPVALREFHQLHGDVIFKPLDGMGGASIFRVKKDDPNLSVIIETLLGDGRDMIMAQRYIPEIVDGDKRILLVDGEPVPQTLARIPAIGESRGNLAAGGSGVAQPLSKRDLWICEQIKPVIKEKQLLFVGVDVIGDYLTEINVTSPTCVRELNAQCDLDIGSDLLVAIESKLN